jgi:hypothetical protein
MTSSGVQCCPIHTRSFAPPPKTADKVLVEELDPPADGDVAAAAVKAAVLPGGGRLTQDDLLSLPAKRAVKSSSAAVEGQVGCAGEGRGRGQSTRGAQASGCEQRPWLPRSRVPKGWPSHPGPFPPRPPPTLPPHPGVPLPRVPL